MNLLNLTVLFHLLSNLPGDFSYNKELRKVVQSTDPASVGYSGKNCKDSLFFQLSLENELKNYIISYCPQDEEPAGWRVYQAVSGETQNRFVKLQDMLIEFGGRLKLFHLKSGHRLLYLEESAKNHKLFYLAPGRSIGIEKFLFYRDYHSGIFSFNDSWYLLFSKEQPSKISYTSILEKIPDKIPFIETQNDLSRSSLAGLYYIEEERLVVFKVAESNDFAIFNITNSKWVHLPMQASISKEERQALAANSFLLKIQSALPGLKRVYYEVYVNGKKRLKTPFQLETEFVQVPLDLSSGPYTIQLVRYVAHEDDNGKTYKKDLNIYQPEPISFQVISNSKYILRLISGGESASKPLIFKLEKYNFN